MKARNMKEDDRHGNEKQAEVEGGYTAAKVSGVLPEMRTADPLA